MTAYSYYVFIDTNLKTYSFKLFVFFKGKINMSHFTPDF